MSTYTLKLYKGKRKLVLERSFDLDQYFMSDVAKESASLIEEAIETNEPGRVKWEEEVGIDA